MSKWVEYSMESKINAVLRNIEQTSRKQGHTFHPPFITAYQLAIALEDQNAGLCATLEKELGGKGTDEHHSLSQYVANELSIRIGDGEIQNVEGAFLSVKDIVSLDFTRGVSSSATDTISLFRLRR